MIAENSIATNTSNAAAFRELTFEETERVSGGNPVGAAVGAVTGAAGYLGTSSTTGDFSWGGLAVATGSGALTGGLGPAGSLTAYVAPRIAFFGGAAIGRADNS